MEMEQEIKKQIQTDKEEERKNKIKHIKELINENKKIHRRIIVAEQQKKEIEKKIIHLNRFLSIETKVIRTLEKETGFQTNDNDFILFY